MALFPSEAVTECLLQQFSSLAAHQSLHVESCTPDCFVGGDSVLDTDVALKISR